MHTTDFVQFAVYAAIILALTPVLGGYMAKVFAGERTFLYPLLRPVERLVYGICGVREDAEQSWKRYAGHLLLFAVVGIVGTYAVLRLQKYLPLNPQGMDNVAPDLAMNTAVSFNTNTNWQNYGGEGTMSYLSQMAALTVHNFLSAATGLAVAIALIRGFARKTTKTIGNFYVDMTRGLLYVLLPISIVGAVFLVWQGVPQTLGPYVDATTVEGAKQTIALGPIASQEVIKELGTNGGGFFNTNSAHPYENPTPLTNFIEDLLIFLIPAALVDTYGRMIGRRKQAYAIYGAMGILFLFGLAAAYSAEAMPNPALAHIAGYDTTQGNMEGKDVRFGVADSVLWAVTTTDTSCGAVNSMHDSLMPLAGMVPLINMLLGCIIFGGVGAGFYGMVLHVILAVFIAGLMVGRTPEYIGKKIESREVKLSIFALFAITVGILAFSAFTAVLPQGLAGLGNNGPHGLSEILYAFTSTDMNNGSAFAGLSGNTLFYNNMLSAMMLIGRFAVVIPILAIAGSFAAKKTVPPSAGTFPTDTGLFVALLIGVVIIVGGLTFFPALALGPIVEHLALQSGALF
ncbi:MAG TPA: potassium-transporting ATPase subunit KdpA [Alphaproteobacteria bacterium]|nr:potassium-transporting ATPase subunit KdpA [Alphaproteobacteria bacterium]